jgi:hypothetical protein
VTTAYHPDQESNPHGWELFYHGGGHVGPYWTLHEAVESAKRKMAPGVFHSCPCVYVRERDPDAPGGYGKVVETIHRQETDNA